MRQQVETLERAKPGSTPLADLKKAIDHSARCHKEAQKLVEQARMALRMSQTRRDIAEDVKDALAERGWRVADSAYEGEAVDGRGWRNAYHLELVHIAGDEVITIIAPDAQGAPDTSRVTLSYTGQSNDVDFNRNLAKTVSDALNQVGLEVGEPRAVPGYEKQSQGDPARRDFNRVRHVQPTRSPG